MEDTASTPAAVAETPGTVEVGSQLQDLAWPHGACNTCLSPPPPIKTTFDCLGRLENCLAHPLLCFAKEGSCNPAHTLPDRWSTAPPPRHLHHQASQTGGRTPLAVFVAATRSHPRITAGSTAYLLACTSFPRQPEPVQRTPGWSWRFRRRHRHPGRPTLECHTGPQQRAAKVGAELLCAPPRRGQRLDGRRQSR